MKRRSAFTLIEMITVIAITAILLGIIIVPMIQSFNFTRAAEGFSESQQKGRQLIEQITREVENSAGVRDNDGVRGQLALVMPGWDGTPISYLAEYAKLDIHMPAQGDPTNVRNGAFVNPNTGQADPTLKGPKGDINVPVAPGLTLVRYFVSLKNPLDTTGTNPGRYFNPYVDYRRQANALWQTTQDGDDNLFVLRRCEVQPYRFVGGAFQVNTDFFADDNGDGRPDFDDPYFMALDAPGEPPLTPAQRTAKIARIKNWTRNSTIISFGRRQDMIQPLFDLGNRTLLVNGNIPRINTLVQFRPTAITSEPADGSTALRLGEETDNGSLVTPDVFKTRHGAWTSAIVRFYPNGYDPNNVAANDYLIGRFDARAGVRSFLLKHYDPDADGDNDDRNGDALDLEVFNVQAYNDQASKGWVYPLTRGMVAANTASGWLGNPGLRSKFVPFLPDLANGRLYTGFGIDQYGIDDPSGATPVRPDNNLPSRGTGDELTPTSDPAPPGNFYDPPYVNNMNRHFNIVWAQNPSLRVPGGVHRYIDLRITPQADGTNSPLHPDPTIGFAQAKIVPGSEIVYGPDQNPGPNYGSPIRYTRVTRNPGKNQYKINYVDQTEPDWAALGYPAPPPAYDPTNFVSAVLQPRYKAGYVQLNSDPNLPLPGNALVSVHYKMQFTRPGDTLTVDYDTRDLVTILLTIRNYPPSTSFPNPQTITLQGAAPVRNYLR